MSFWTKIMSIGALVLRFCSSVPAWAVSPHSGPYGCMPVQYRWIVFREHDA